MTSPKLLCTGTWQTTRQNGVCPACIIVAVANERHLVFSAPPSSQQNKAGTRTAVVRSQCKHTKHDELCSSAKQLSKSSCTGPAQSQRCIVLSVPELLLPLAHRGVQIHNNPDAIPTHGNLAKSPIPSKSTLVTHPSPSAPSAKA